jgi:hypothetical protein
MGGHAVSQKHYTPCKDVAPKCLFMFHRFCYSPRREKIKQKAVRKYLVLVLGQTPGLRVDIAIERVKAAAIGTHIAYAVFGRLGIEIRFRWCIEPVPCGQSARTRTATT